MDNARKVCNCNPLCHFLTVFHTASFLLDNRSSRIVIMYCILSLAHVRWVPCHHGMARPQVADGGNGLQIRRVAANILNKQSRTADKGWSSSVGVGRGANNSSP
jgi:hypothetical protein